MESTWFHVADEPQLFVDNALIECTQGLTRRWHKPERIREKPVIVADRPWEQTLYFTYSNYVVLHDPADGLTKCWYEDMGQLDGRVHPWATRVLYAQSEDGINFHKPALDICKIGGKRTNIVMGYAGAGAEPSALNPWAHVGVHSNGIVIDPHAVNSAERFRTIFSRGTFDAAKGTVRHETECAHSPDGLHWQPYGQRPELGSSGQQLNDVSCLHYDPDARMFVQNTRHGLMGGACLPERTPRVGGWFAPYYPHRPDLMNKRRVWQTRSHDFLHWSEPIPVSTPDDVNDNLDEGHYGMQQFRVGRMHFATLGILRFVDNEMDVRLLCSRDGLRFQAADRGNPFLTPRGGKHWDRHMVSITSPPVEHGDDWHFYHGGSACHHDYWMAGSEGVNEAETRDPAAHVKFGLGVARLRKEGVASLCGSRQRPGYVLTRPLLSGGTRLFLNARCGKGGSIDVAVLDRNDQAMEACSKENCDTFTGDATAHEVTWKGSCSAGKPGVWRKLLFHVRNAEIYGFRFA